MAESDEKYGLRKRLNSAYGRKPADTAPVAIECVDAVDNLNTSLHHAMLWLP